MVASRATPKLLSITREKGETAAARCAFGSTWTHPRQPQTSSAPPSRSMKLLRLHTRLDNSCKRRAEYLRRSFVMSTQRVVSDRHLSYGSSRHTLAEVSVTDLILRKFPNSQKSWGNWACANSVYQALFSPPTHYSLGRRLNGILLILPLL